MKTLFFCIVFWLVLLATNPVHAAAGGFSAPVGLAFAGDGSLYVAEWGANRVTRVARGGARETVIDSIPAPAGLALDEQGNLYIAGYGDSNIYVWNGGKPRLLATGLAAPVGMYWSRADGLLVANRNGGEIIRIHPDGRKEVVSRGHKLPAGIARNGSLFVSCYGGGVDCLGKDGKRRGFGQDMGAPAAGIVAAPGGGVYVADFGKGEIVHILPDGASKVAASGLKAPVGLVWRPDGRLMAGCWGDNSLQTLAISR